MVCSPLLKNKSSLAPLPVFVASAESGQPLVPLTLHGTRSVLRDGSWFPRRQPIMVLIHPAIRPQGNDWSAALRLRNEARHIILEHCGEPDLAAQG